MTLIKLLALGHLSTSLAYSWPSLQYDALEEVLYEGIGGSSGGFFVNVVEKCKHRTENPQKSTVAAEWLRFVGRLFCTDLIDLLILVFISDLLLGLS